MNSEGATDEVDAVPDPAATPLTGTAPTPPVTSNSDDLVVAVSRTYPWQHSGLRSRALRGDRILAEVRATGGDARPLADLFGVSIESAGRYVDTLDHPGLAAAGTHVQRTSTPT